VRAVHSQNWDLHDIRIRDPFVLADPATETYYMYAQMDNRLNREGDDRGVEVYKSKDLQSWQGPYPVLILPDDWWATRMVWAPEVHPYKDRYYLFVTLTSWDALPENKPVEHQNWPKLFRRGTQIFVSDSPEGPFKAFANQPHTPSSWQCLDGTLWEEAGRSYMIFCHEWTQIMDGSVELVELSADLSTTRGKSKALFHASDASWVLKKTSEVTDGPFLYRTDIGDLLMIWSSFGEKGYAVGAAISVSGKVTGPWRQSDQLLFEENGGHGMIFKTFDQRLVLTLHQPNTSPDERAQFFEVKDQGDHLTIIGALFR